MTRIARLARWLAPLAALLLCGLGCGAEDDGASSVASGGSGGTGGNPTSPASLAFESETLTMVPGEERTVAITATPAGVYRVRFALLGDARDASLDVTEIDTGADGGASVRLTAPTQSTTFTLRATAGTTVAQAGVSVSASGFATLQVKPQYGGKRGISYWVASVRTGTTCAQLSGKPVDDGDLKASAPFDQVPQISDVPVGPALAVTLRGGYSVAGCTDVPEVRAGEINQVTVQVADLPMKLSETDLLIDLGIEQAGPLEWTAALDGAATNASDALLDGATDDVSALLSAMADATPTPADASAFATLQGSEDWHQVALGTLGGAGAKTALRTQMLVWMAQGTETLGGPKTFSGRLESAGMFPGKAVVELVSVAGIDAPEAGFASTNEAPTWQAEPGDSVLLGTKLHFSSSRLLTALAKAPAESDVPGAAGVPEALAETLGCGPLASALVAAGANPNEAHPGCNVACMRALCEDALVTLWQRVRDASLTSPQLSSIEVTATGDAVVDDQARPTAFSGKWLGSLDLGAISVPVSGSVVAVSPPPPS